MKKIIVNSQNPEFGFELISTITYAYYKYLKGHLLKTISAIGSEPFYFFSPKHEINKTARSWYNVKKMTTPNSAIHKPTLNKTQFAVPDYRKQFKNEIYKFGKPIVVISNRYNIEWGGNPFLNKAINYFDLEILKKLFILLQDKYQVVYFNIALEKGLQDNAPAMDLKEWGLLNKYPKIKNIYELKYNFTYNSAQLRIFANCNKFITMNGGGSILASFFKGENIIYCKRTEVNGRLYPRELQTGDFGYYSDFSGSKIFVVNLYNDLLAQIKRLWL